MALESMTCPNCGAKVEFPTGASTTTCKFCNSTLRLLPQVVSVGAPNSEPDPYRNLADLPQIKDLLAKGRRMEAIRLYMEQTGASLKEARTAIEKIALEANIAQPDVPDSFEVDWEPIKELLARGNKLEAIKVLRQQTDLGLKEAKDAVEAVERGEQPEIARNLPRTPTGSYTVDIERITDLLARGNKIEAIKVLREQTHLGLKEAKDAVEVIERGGLPTITHDQREVAKGRSSGLAARFGCLVAILPVLLSIAACAVLMGLSSQVMFRAWGPYDYAMTLVRNSAEAKEALGEPLNTGLFMFGGIGSDDRSSDASFETPIYGSKRSGSLRVSGSWERKNGWDVSVWIYYDTDGEEQTIYLTGRQK
ncbi:MAG: ribosomal protein L7/L12 [Anaerolineae bacterium]